jgi:hypothetical protein
VNVLHPEDVRIVMDLFVETIAYFSYEVSERIWLAGKLLLVLASRAILCFPLQNL